MTPQPAVAPKACGLCGGAGVLYCPEDVHASECAFKVGGGDKVDREAREEWTG